MDSGAWIAMMMLGGTSLVILLVAFGNRPSPSNGRTPNGWRTIAEDLRRDLDEFRHENQRLKSANADLSTEVDRLIGEKAVLDQLSEYWRARYLAKR